MRPGCRGGLHDEEGEGWNCYMGALKRGGEGEVGYGDTQTLRNLEKREEVGKGTTESAYSCAFWKGT